MHTFETDRLLPASLGNPLKSFVRVPKTRLSVFMSRDMNWKGRATCLTVARMVGMLSPQLFPISHNERHSVSLC